MLSGKVAIITGASRGIGAATARRFAAEGAAVVLAARGPDALAKLVAEIEDHGGRAIACPTDVTDETAVAALVARAIEEFGRLDVAVNNAGGGNSGLTKVADLQVDQFDRSLDVNLHGVFYALKHEIPAMLDAGGGAIVNISSGAGLRAPAAGTSAYVTAKHGVQGLTKSAALDYAANGIRINAIAPGPIDTDLLANAGEQGRLRIAQSVPLQRLGRPEEIAAAAAWLCSNEASFVTGATLEIDGGLAAKG